jgi:hypothetical protein
MKPVHHVPEHPSTLSPVYTEGQTRNVKPRALAPVLEEFVAAPDWASNLRRSHYRRVAVILTTSLVTAPFE